MAFNISNINGGTIILNDPILDSNGGNLIVIANDPQVFNNNIIRSDTHIVYYYTGENITINNTGTYYFNDNSVYNTGPTGYTGYQGPIGFQGAVGAGVQGPKGEQGLQGVRGTDGIIGVNGVQGSQGIIGKGFVIFANVNSFIDISSVSPSNSNIGEFVLVKGGDLYIYNGNNMGSTGPNNSYSYAGDITDESKLNGFQGPQGLIGTAGSNGFQGSQGFQGLVGSAGSNGVQGSQGVQGLVGIAGSNGVQGPQGFQGFQGLVGSAGSNGVQGFQGILGPQGVAGSANATIASFNGSFDTSKTINIISYTGANYSWVTRITGISNESLSNCKSDLSGNLYVGGFYASTTSDIYNSDGNSYLNIVSNGLNDAFIVKYNSSGESQWVTKIAGTANDSITTIDCDASNNVFVCGSYVSRPVTVYNSDGSTFSTLSQSSTGTSFYDSFVVKYNSSGTSQWATRLSGLLSDAVSGISVDISGNSYLCGSYGSSPITIYNSNDTVFSTLSYT